MANRVESKTANAFHSLLAAFLAGTSVSAVIAGGDVEPQLSRGVDPSNGLTSWRWENEEIAITLAQRAPDQTRSFFEARGFDPESANLFAEECVFKTIFENVGPPDRAGVVSYDLGQWRVLVDGNRRPLARKDEWDRRWRARGVSRKARIAFTWALFPTRQRFGPGDRQWGMTSYGLPPGRQFDLEIAWQRDGVRRRGRIEGLVCAPDVRVAAD